jgi:hypothetical protein
MIQMIAIRARGMTVATVIAIEMVAETAIGIESGETEAGTETGERKTSMETRRWGARGVSEVVLMGAIGAESEAGVVIATDANLDETDAEILRTTVIHIVPLAVTIIVAVGALVLVLGLLMLIGTIVPADAIGAIVILARMTRLVIATTLDAVEMVAEGGAVAQSEQRVDRRRRNWLRMSEIVVQSSSSSLQPVWGPKNWSLSSRRSDQWKKHRSWRIE